MSVKAAWVLAVLALPMSTYIKDARKEGNPFGGTIMIPGCFRGPVYHLQPGTEWLPKFERLRPVGTVYACVLDVPTQSYMNPILGVTDRIEWFAIDYQADFWIHNPGRYRFSLASDDGSILYIDGHTVINNDGQHATVQLFGETQLESGKHQIRVSYFQGPRFEVALMLSVAGPGEKMHAFDMRDFQERPSVTALTEDEEEARPILTREATPVKAFEVAALKALESRAHDFDYLAAGFRFRPDAIRSQYAVVLQVPATAIQATPVGAQGQNRLHVTLVGQVKNGEGQVVDKFSEDFRTLVTDERLALLRTSTLNYSRALSLEAGKYTVETAVVDREGNRSGTKRFPVEIRPAKGLGLSSVILMQRVEPVTGAGDGTDPFRFEDRRVVPELAAELGPSAQPQVYFVVYPDKWKKEAPQIRVEILTGGSVVAQQTANLPAPDASGTIAMTIAAVAAPGHWELRITALQGGDAVTESVKYAIVAP